jgi:integrase/recombinase XerD
MFDKLVKRSDSVWVYKTGRFAEERCAFLCDLNERGHSYHTLRNVNRILLAVAERINVRQRMPITSAQIARAANNWIGKSCASSSRPETREHARRRFVFVAQNWFRFLGKWSDPERNPQFKSELESFLKDLHEKRGYSDATLSTRKGALNIFFEWLGKQNTSLKKVSPKTLSEYFVQNKERGWKKTTIKSYVQSLRAFFRYASQHGWCLPGLDKTMQSPRVYSAAGLPEGPTWDAVQRLLANINTEQPRHIRDRAIILLLTVYGLRIGEVCGLTLDDLDWDKEKIRIRRSKNKRIQEFPLTAEAGNAILKYLRHVRPQTAGRSLFFTLSRPYRPMITHGASSSISIYLRALGCCLPHYGPHSLRHACATHLLNEGFSLKEIGDQLGHQSPRSTLIYAKVERAKLKEVSALNLSGLTEYLRAQTQVTRPDWEKERLGLLREVSNIGLGGLQ